MINWRLAMWEMTFNEFHSLKYYWEGDGWNEPYSDRWTCACEDPEYPRDDVFEISWVQIDPECSGRPDFEVVVKQWLDHVVKERKNDF